MRRLFRGLGRNVVGLGTASFFTDLASEMIAPLLPLFLKREFRAGAATLGVIEGAADCVASLLRIFSGWISDRLRKRKLLVVLGYGVTVVVRPLMGLVLAAWHVGVLRLADRIGKGIRLAPRDALIADSCDPDVRGKAFGLQRMLDNFGGVLGMLVAATILATLAWDYRRIFLLTAIPAAAVILVVLLVVRDVPPRGKPAELRLSLRPFSDRYRWFLLTVAVFTLGNSSDWFILFRLSELGLEDHWAIYVWCAHTTVRMLLALPAGIFADRFGKKRVVLFGWLVYAGVYAGFALVSSLAAALVLVGVYAIYWSTADSVLRAIVADLVPEDLRGTAYGLYHFSVGVTILPANLLFGLVWKFGGHRAAFFTSAALALAACAMLAGLRRPATPRPAAP